jgi:hypothetical protein
VTPTKRRYTFYISPELDQALDRLKTRDGIAESEAIRRALTEFLKKRGIVIREGKAERRRPRTKR